MLRSELFIFPKEVYQNRKLFDPSTEQKYLAEVIFLLYLLCKFWSKYGVKT